LYFVLGVYDSLTREVVSVFVRFHCHLMHLGRFHVFSIVVRLHRDLVSRDGTTQQLAHFLYKRFS
jgi:hypothetical protein